MLFDAMSLHVLSAFFALPAGFRSGVSISA
jgi:hypothetical protein